MAEQVWHDMVVLRTAIDVTPYNERVYWEGEFARTYHNTGILVPDRQTWLTQHNLPAATDMVLDDIFEKFTGYSQTKYVQNKLRLTNASNLLKQTMSTSTHILTPNLNQIDCQSPSVVIPTVMKITQL